MVFKSAVPLNHEDLPPVLQMVFPGGLLEAVYMVPTCCHNLGLLLLLLFGEFSKILKASMHEHEIEARTSPWISKGALEYTTVGFGHLAP